MPSRFLAARVRRRSLIRMTGLAAAVPALAACGKRTPTRSGAASAAKVVALGPDQSYNCTPGQEPWRTAGPPKRGGTLVKATLDWSSLDPTQPGGSPSEVAPQVYNSLLSYRSCFWEDTAYVPDLAQSWTTTPDGLTWTLHLRNDVKWHDVAPVSGRPFTSADVAWNIDFNLAPGSLQRTNWANVVKHQEPDPYTVVLTLGTPDAEAINKLEATLMLPHEVHDKYGDFKTIVAGTGAFMLKSSEVNQQVLISRSPAYHLSGVDGRPLPYVDNVQMIHYGDPSGEVAAMRAGTLDMSNYRGFSLPDAQAVKQANPRLQVYQQVQYAVEGLWFNCSKAPWNDARVRKALSLAINRDDIVAANQGGVTYCGFLPRGLTDYAWSLDTMKEKFKADPAQAKALLTQAGLNPGDINLTLTSAEIHRTNVQVVQQQLKQIGVNATIAFGNESSTLLLQKQNWDFAWLVNGGLTSPGVCANIVRSGTSSFRTRLVDPKIDQLCDAQIREVDPAKRKMLLDQLQDYLYEVMPYAPATSTIYNHVWSPRVKDGPKVLQSYNPITPVYVWLDPTNT
jgi:peptide/nickel transport system substrate-binding protein